MPILWSRVLPGFRTACHSLSLFCTGWSILRESAVENNAPRNGIVGIDARSACAWGRIVWVKGEVEVRRVVLLKV